MFVSSLEDRLWLIQYKSQNVYLVFLFKAYDKFAGETKAYKTEVSYKNERGEPFALALRCEYPEKKVGTSLIKIK